MDWIVIYFWNLEALKSFLGDKFKEGKKVANSAQTIIEGEDNELVMVNCGEKVALIGNISHYIDDEDFSQKLQKASINSEVLFLYSQDVIGCVMLEHYRNGEVLRQWISSEGEIESDIGDNSLYNLPNAEELDEDNDPDFWDLVEIAEEITGIDWDLMEGEGFSLN